MERAVQVRVIGSDPGGSPTNLTWAARAALLTFLVMVGVPLLILFGVAIAAAALVFGGLALLTGASRRIKAALPGHDGRANVRVKR